MNQDKLTFNKMTGNASCFLLYYSCRNSVWREEAIQSKGTVEQELANHKANCSSSRLLCPGSSGAETGTWKKFEGERMEGFAHFLKIMVLCYF